MWRNAICCLVALSVGCNLFSSSPDDERDVEDFASSGDVGADLPAMIDVGAIDMDMDSADEGADADVCVPESDVQLCERLVVNCDTITAEDNCGNLRTAVCGVCTTPAVCGGGGTPNVCACPDQTDADFCAQQAAVCGAVSAIDDCGVQRTVSCGTCNANETCMAGACSCVPETDAEFCTAESAECGSVQANDRCGTTRSVDCGNCANGEVCAGNVCVDDPCPDAVCDPATEDATSCPQDCGAIAVAAGAQHTCAVRADGTLLCWGGDSDGQLGIGGVAGPQPPTIVNPPDSPVTQIAVAATAEGLGTCAAGPDGLFCWGNGAAGQNGVGSSADLDEPEQLTATVPDAIGVGSTHRCYAEGANVFCWGEGQFGRLGTGNETNRNVPTSVSGFSGTVTEFALGDRHTCARLASGNVECVGSNLNGQQGNGMGGSGMFNLVGGDVGLSNVERLAAGHDHNCAVVDSGATEEVHCWGQNSDGQVGNGSTTNQLMPLMVATAGNVRSISAGTGHTCIVDGNDEVTCWGRNAEGQLGLSGSGDRTSPAAVSLPFDVESIHAGHHHTCAIAVDLTVWCWGANAQGQLGDAAAASGSTPVQVPF